MTLLTPVLMQAEVAAEGGSFPVWFTAVYVVGFIAAVTIGWEGQERPDWVPDVEPKEGEGSEQ